MIYFIQSNLYFVYFYNFYNFKLLLEVLSNFRYHINVKIYLQLQIKIKLT